MLKNVVNNEWFARLSVWLTMTFLLYFHTTKLMVSFIVHSYKTTYEKNRGRLVWAAALWKKFKDLWTFRNKSDKNKFTNISQKKRITDSCWVLKLSPKSLKKKLSNSKRKLFWDQRLMMEEEVEKRETKIGVKKKGTDHRLDNKH